MVFFATLIRQLDDSLPEEPTLLVASSQSRIIYAQIGDRNDGVWKCLVSP